MAESKSDTKDTETKDTKRSTKDTGPVDLGNGLSPEGVPYQGPSAPWEETLRKGEDPERVRLQNQIDALQEQLDAS